MNFRNGLFTLVLISLANVAQAVPQEMIYEGFLTDLGDRPINESLSIQVGLFADADAAEPIWREDHASVDVDQGYFILRLGSDTSLPIQVFNGGDLYLGVSIDGTEIRPRRLFASVAFALRAGQADDVAGRNISPRSVMVGGDVVIDENGRWVGDPTGLQGPAGADGERGPMGDRGPAGDQGDRGPQGIQGERGATGERGPAGVAGDRGPAGPQGAVGATGPRGDRGPVGEQGATGDRGLTGPAGTQGAQGETGPQGATGAQGERGLIGPAGAQGVQGERGSQGVAGAAGAQGDQGPAGPQGATGAAGPSGSQGATGATGPQGPAGPQGAAGTSFVHWGVASCPGGAQVVYTGVAAGAYYQHGGSGANTLCLPNNPQHRDFHDGNHNGALLYGVEYETNGGGSGHIANRHDRDAVCAVCWVPDRSHTLMIPGRYDCYDGWTEAYDGQLMASHYTQAKSEFVCVARQPTIAGSSTNHNGHLWYPTEIECGSLNCNATGYRQDREVSCVVCTR